VAADEACGAFQMKPSERRPLKVLASIVWKNEEPFGIVLVRRWDCTIAHGGIPIELEEELARLNKERVFFYQLQLRELVERLVKDAVFLPDATGMARCALDNGRTPAELGALRFFGSPAIVGVDIGEFHQRVWAGQLN